MVDIGSDLWGSSHPPTLLKKGYLKQVAQDHVKMAFEYLKDGDFTAFLGNL